MKVRWTGGVRRLAMAALVAAVLVPGAAHAQGKITGKVALSGAAPAAAKLKMDADPVCAAAHPDGAAAEDVVREGGERTRRRPGVGDARPRGAVPLPRVAEDLAARHSAEQNGSPAQRVVREMREGARRRPGSGDTRPRGAVPFPRVAELAGDSDAAEEHDAAAPQVVGHLG